MAPENTFYNQDAQMATHGTSLVESGTLDSAEIAEMVSHLLSRYCDTWAPVL